MKPEKKEMAFPMLSQNDIMDAHPEHYGKMVVIKGFNNNTIVAYGDTWKEAEADAKSKGYKIVGHVDDPEPPNIMLYCPCPCESHIGISTIVSGEMLQACETDPICPVCKHGRKVKKVMKDQSLDGIKIFLSGAIDRVSDDGIQWREEIRDKCEDLPFVFLDPTDKPDGLGCEVGMEKHQIKNSLKDGDWEGASKWSHDVRHIDLRMIDKTDLYIVYIDLDAHLCGTYNELFEAEKQQKPLFAIMKEPYDKTDFPGWLVSIFREEEVFNSIDECVKYLKKLYAGEIELDERWLRILV